jgi:hypothetical protein
VLLTESKAGSDVFVAVPVHDSNRQALFVGASDVGRARVDDADAKWHFAGDDCDVLENLVHVATPRERGIPDRAGALFVNHAPGREVVVGRGLTRELVVRVVGVNDRCTRIETTKGVVDDLAWLAWHVRVSPLGASAVDRRLDDDGCFDDHGQTPIKTLVSKNSSKP